VHVFTHVFIGHKGAVARVWPQKGLRNQKVALGRKRLCTTGLIISLS